MARTRPEAAEARAVQEVLGAAERTGAPVYFVHQTIPAAVDEVIAARQRGVRAFSESCPHYLVLDDSCYAGEHPERYVCCPPIRDRAAVDELGSRLAMGYVHTVGSDHCCYDTGQKELRAHDVRAMPNGLPGVETRLSVVWDAYVASGRISPQRFVAVMAANPARLNGLYPRKGAIAPGADADLVLFDPAATRVVRSGELHMETDYTPYEGREVTGWPRTVLARGPGRGPGRRAHRPRAGGPVPARGPHRPDMSDPRDAVGEATRRAVLGDAHVDRSDAGITDVRQAPAGVPDPCGLGRGVEPRRARSARPQPRHAGCAGRAAGARGAGRARARRGAQRPQRRARSARWCCTRPSTPGCLPRSAALRVAERTLVEIGSLPG